MGTSAQSDLHAKAYLTPLDAMATPSPGRDALLGMPRLMDLGTFASTRVRDVRPHIAPHFEGVVFAGATPRCYGLGALANIALSMARAFDATYTTLFIHPPDPAKMPSMSVADGIARLGDLLGDPTRGIWASPSSGVVHVASAVIDEIGYPTPSLSDDEVFVDYTMRARHVGFHRARGPAPSPAHRDVCAQYGGFEAAMRMWQESLLPVTRQFTGPIAGVETLRTLDAAMFGLAPIAWFVSDPLGDRVAVLIHQADALS